MSKTLILTDDAQQDLDKAYRWYQEQNHGLRKEFIRCVDAKLSEISRHPLHHQVIQSKIVRRALISRFPFSLFYFILSMKKKRLLFLLFFINEEVRNLGNQGPNKCRPKRRLRHKVNRRKGKRNQIVLV